MKFIFIIQGEGRGHMTQALALLEILQNMGHKVSSVCIGKSEHREVPQFVKNQFSCPIHIIDSPNFIFDKIHKGILMGKTISTNLRKIKSFNDSLKKIHLLVTRYKPDIIINFYDLLGGIYNALFKPKCQFWVIGHQYLSLHSQFPYAKGDFLGKTLFRINTKITSLGSDQYLALSFQDLPKEKKENLHVLPPLLRKEIKDLTIHSGEYFLTYMVNPGYSEEVLRYAKQNPEFQIEAFWDKKNAPDPYKPFKNVVFHKINEKMFLEKMAGCRGLVSTAGFESICEAMYLGKPVMMVPVKGHYEQACNAEDAIKAKGGVIGKTFDFGVFNQFIETNSDATNPMRNWQDQFQSKFSKVLKKAKANHELISYQNQASNYKKSTKILR